MPTFNFENLIPSGTLITGSFTSSVFYTKQDYAFSVALQWSSSINGYQATGSNVPLSGTWAIQASNNLFNISTFQAPSGSGLDVYNNVATWISVPGYIQTGSTSGSAQLYWCANEAAICSPYVRLSWTHAAGTGTLLYAQAQGKGIS